MLDAVILYRFLEKTELFQRNFAPNLIGFEFNEKWQSLTMYLDLHLRFAFAESQIKVGIWVEILSSTVCIAASPDFLRLTIYECLLAVQWLNQIRLKLKKTKKS